MSSNPFPKNIFQTWKTRDVPKLWKQSQASIQKHMSDWNYRLTTDKDNEEIVETFFPEYLEFYKNLKYGIQRADMIRPMLLYLYGGIYIDLDFVLNKPLDDLFKEGDLFFIPSSNTTSVITNSFMASKAKHPFWLDYLKAIVSPIPWWAVGKHLVVMTSTGPLRLAGVVSTTPYVYSILPHKIVAPCSVCDVSNNDCKGGYIRGIQGCSWNEWDSACLNFFLCNKKELLTFFVIVLIVFLTFKVLSK